VLFSKSSLRAAYNMMFGWNVSMRGSVLGNSRRLLRESGVPFNCKKSLASQGQQALSCPMSAFVNKILLEHRHVHLFASIMHD
jgi:hypothetical protein